MTTRQQLSLTITRVQDARAFGAQAIPFLLPHEAQHCLTIGLITTLAQQPNLYGDMPPYFALVTADDAGATPRVVAALVRTPPHNLALCLIPDTYVAPALELIAQDAYALYGDTLPGVVGPAAIAAAFAAQWSRLTQQPHEVITYERVYQLTTVIPVSGVAGALRRATVSDHPILEAWISAFGAEALHGEPIAANDWVARRLAAPPDVTGLYLWEDNGQPVTMVGYTGPTPNGMRIGPVYTPPALRRRGYASACVAALSQRLLDDGRRACFLFTDLSNPTANHIYQTIGYHPTGDVTMYQFGKERA